MNNNTIYRKGLVVVLIITVIIIASVWIKLASKEKDIISDGFYEKSNDSIERDVNNDEMIHKDNAANKDEKSVVIVEIDGAVKNPGVYEFAEGDRVNDAIIKAGGLSDKAYTKNINKARRLTDEEKIYIPKEDEETLNLEMINDSVYNTTEPQKNDKININAASKELLMSLKGIGEVYARKIIEYREKTRFTTIEDIKRIDGIGDKTFENIKELITVK